MWTQQILKVVTLEEGQFAYLIKKRKFISWVVNIYFLSVDKLFIIYFSIYSINELSFFLALM